MYLIKQKEIQQLKENNPNFLYLCQIHVNYVCNIIPEANCIQYCYQRNKVHGEMTFNTFKQIIDKYTPRQIAFGGGEPILHPELLTFIKYAKEIVNVKHVNYTTNGVSIPAYFDEMKDLVSGVSFSLDTLRFPDLFIKGIPSKIKANLKKYLDSPIKVIVNFVVNNSNYKDLRHIIPFLKQNNLDAIYVLSYKEKGYGIPFTHEEFRPIFAQFLLDAARNEVLVAMDCCLSSFDSKKNLCGAGKVFKAFEFDGTESPCSFYKILEEKVCPFIEKYI